MYICILSANISQLINYCWETQDATLLILGFTEWQRLLTCGLLIASINTSPTQITSVFFSFCWHFYPDSALLTAVKNRQCIQSDCVLQPDWNIFVPTLLAWNEKDINLYLKLKFITTVFCYISNGWFKGTSCKSYLCLLLSNQRIRGDHPGNRNET